MKVNKFKADPKQMACPECGCPLRMVGFSYQSDSFIFDHKIGFDLQNKNCSLRYKHIILPFDDLIGFYRL